MIFDSVVVGGGVIGLMTARELVLVGQRVAVIDAGRCGQESSWAGGGIVSPLYPWRYLDAITVLASRAQAFYPSLCQTLASDTGIDPEFEKSGLLLLSVDDKAQAIEWALQKNKQLDKISVDHLYRVQADVIGNDEALLFPDVAQVRNPRLIKALVADVQRRGITLLENEVVLRFNTGNHRVNSVTTSHHTICAETFIVCAGAWSTRLLTENALSTTSSPVASISTGTAPSIKPIRGQMLLFAPHQHNLKRIVLRDGRYLIPRRDGRILCGSTVEDVGFDKSTTESARESLHASALSIMPSLRAAHVERHWSGLRPASPEGIPYIGPISDYQNLFINAGQYRNGVVLAPASAQLLVDLVLQRTPHCDPAPYAINALRQ